MGHNTTWGQQYWLKHPELHAPVRSERIPELGPQPNKTYLLKGGVVVQTVSGTRLWPTKKIATPPKPCDYWPVDQVNTPKKRKAGWRNGPTSKSARAAWVRTHRQRRLWLADYHHMVDFGMNMDQIAERLKYKNYQCLRRQLDRLETHGYTVRWPEFPAPSYDDINLRWWREKLEKTA